MKILVVGSGLSGTVFARIACDAGHNVLVLETREHIGGNCFDEVCEDDSIRVHRYGPHTFHTSNSDVVNFVTRFTDWITFNPVVRGRLRDGSLIPVPFNLESAEITGTNDPQDIVRLVFRDYSEKQWGMDYSKIPDSITNRVPKIRQSFNPYYHVDTFVGVPRYGYESMFNNLLEGIQVECGVGYREWERRRLKYDLLVFTGRIDHYFSRSGYGCELDYRSLKFEHRTSDQKIGCFQINECNNVAQITRRVDYGYLPMGERLDRKENGLPTTSHVVLETPIAYQDGMDPYYPMNFGKNGLEAGRLRKVADSIRNVIFLGRLGRYTYMDMHVAISLAMSRAYAVVK